MMGAYSDEKIYSVELVGAVLRQGTFVGKMYDLGWTRPDYFHGKQDELLFIMRLRDTMRMFIVAATHINDFN